MSTTAPATKPKSALGRHRILAPTAGARVSPLCLGAMNFGTAWTGILGECSQETAFEMMDFFYEQGGNFIDTANGYQQEQSEMWIGEWLEKNGKRDEFILATKYTSGYMTRHGAMVQQSNFGGNSAKSLHVSVEASLRKLKTSYIDLLYVHYWDMTTSLPEVMQSLNHLVQAGKVIYLGISDTPAWIVSKANQYARDHGLRQFSVYQGQWSAADRDFEREIIPMCNGEGMSLAPWGALGGGYFRPKGEKKEGGRNMPRPDQDRVDKVSEALEKIAEREGTIITSVALAYVMHKNPYVFPICGGRSVKHLKGNIEALSLELSDEDMEEIESAVPFSVGFPMSMLGGGPKGARGPEEVVFSHRLGHFDYVQRTKPIRPHKE